MSGEEENLIEIVPEEGGEAAPAPAEEKPQEAVPVEEPQEPAPAPEPVEEAPEPEPVPEPEPAPVEEEQPEPVVEEEPEEIEEVSEYDGPKVINRWLIVVGAILIQLALGAIYSWSVFTAPLKDDFRFSTTDTQMIFSMGLLAFALVMVYSGRMLTKHSPRKIAIWGGLLLGAGYMIASMMGGNFIGLFVSIGIIGGAGIGMAYVVPIAVCMKWFPDKKGLISGFAVAGFGFGATIWVKLAGSWGNLIGNLGIHTTFFIYGVIFLVMVVGGGLLMINPPEGWLPRGWTPPEHTASGPSGYNYTPKRLFRTKHAKKQFYMIWSMFVFGALAGLMVIGIIKLYGRDALTAGGMDSAEALAIAGTAMAVFYAIFNGIGRIVWGAVADKIGTKKSLMAMFSFQAIMMFTVFQLGKSEYGLYMAAALIGFNFGGNFSLFPTTTAEFFGTKTVGQNYGYVFTAYGIGGVIGPMMAGYFRDSGGSGVESWYPAFIIAGVLCVVAVVMAVMLKPPAPPRRRKGRR